MLARRPLLLTIVCALCLASACRSSGEAGQPADSSVSEPDPDATEPPEDVPEAAPDVLPPPPACRSEALASARWYDHAIGYEVFVRSFSDSDGDGIGDLKGLTARLDYLNDGDPATDDDLGVDLLWLMPVNPSPSYHGYDVVDYRDIEPDYGTLADLDALLAAAEARGIRIITDFVINHSSSQHPWFEDAATGPEATHRDFYVWSDTFLDWARPWGPGPTWHAQGDSYYYALFWQGMPDLNFRTPAVRQQMIDAARFWLARGVTGFRLDAARYLIESGGGSGQADTEETHAFWREFAAAMAEERSDALLVGEVWTDTAIVATYFGTEDAGELDMAFDFDLSRGVLDAIVAGHPTSARFALCNRLRGFPAYGRAGVFLTNHDQIRVATQLKAAGPEALELAAFVLLTWPGTPWIYYGEEIGMRNGSGSGDEAKRLPMQWSGGPFAGFSTQAAWRDPQSIAEEDSVVGQLSDATSLLRRYQRLIRIRQKLPILQQGSTNLIAATGSSGEPLVLRRDYQKQTVLLIHNFGQQTMTVTVAAAGLPATLAFRDELSGQSWQRASAATDLELPEVPARGAMLLVAD